MKDLSTAPEKNKDTKSRRSLYAKILCFGLMVFAVVADQITKLIVLEHMTLGEEIPLWRGVFHWKYIQNRGAAFGMLADRREVFLVLSTVAIIALLVYLFRTRTTRFWWLSSIGMIVGGGIGNMIDRIAYGYVVDFMYVKLINFAVFNVADCFVTVGAGILFFLMIRDIIKEERAEKAKKKAAKAADDATKKSEAQDDE